MAGPLHPVDGLVTRLIAQAGRPERPEGEEPSARTRQSGPGVKLTISSAARRLAAGQELLEAKLIEQHERHAGGRER